MKSRNPVIMSSLKELRWWLRKLLRRPGGIAGGLFVLLYHTGLKWVLCGRSLEELIMFKSLKVSSPQKG